jgi:hypothetical protein
MYIWQFFYLFDNTPKQQQTPEIILMIGHKGPHGPNGFIRAHIRANIGFGSEPWGEGARLLLERYYGALIMGHYCARYGSHGGPTHAGPKLGEYWVPYGLTQNGPHMSNNKINQGGASSTAKHKKLTVGTVIYIIIYGHTCTYLYVYVYAWTYTCTRVHTHTEIYIRIRNVYTHITFYIYTYIAGPIHIHITNSSSIRARRWRDAVYSANA